MSKYTWKEKWLAGCLAVTVLCSPTVIQAKQASFTDIERSYARDSINILSEQGIMQGVSDSSFAPNQQISRQHFAAVLAKTMGVQPIYPEQPTFTDVVPTQAEYGYVEALVNLGILTGTSKSFFSGEQALSRQDAAVILARVLTAVLENKPIAAPYQDQDKIAAYAEPAVSFVSKEGLMSGYNKMFLPQQALTRAEAAVIAHRLLERGNLVGDYFWGVAPAAIELKVGEQQQIKILSQAAPLAYTPVFGLDNPGLGSLSPDGLFIATTPGKGLITVNVGRRHHEVMVTVHE